jgi:hypothetical protein
VQEGRGPRPAYRVPYYPPAVVEDGEAGAHEGVQGHAHAVRRLSVMVITPCARAPSDHTASMVRPALGGLGGLNHLELWGEAGAYHQVLATSLV